MNIEIGYPVKINNRALDVHAETGTIVRVDKDVDGTTLCVEVQIDGSERRVWIPRANFELLGGVFV